MFKKLPVLILGLFILSACADPADEIDSMVENGEFLEAVEWMDEEVAGAPEDPLFNGLAAEIKTRICIKENCTEKKPELLKEIANHLKHVKKPVETDDGTKRDIYANLLKISSKFKRNDNHPTPIIAFMDTIPSHIPQENFAKMLMDMATDSIHNIEIPTTLSLLSKIEQIAPDSDFAVYTPLIHAMVSNNRSALNSVLERAKQPNGVLTKEVASLIPYAYFFQEIEKDSDNGAFTFIKSFDKKFADLEKSKQTYADSRKLISISLKNMANNEKFIDMASNHINKMTEVTHKKSPKVEKEEPKTSPPAIKATAIETPTTKEETALNDQAKKNLFKLHVLKTSLIFSPDQQDVWDEFLQPAMDYVDSTGFVDLLFEGIDQTKIPKNAVQPYNEKLFTIIKNKLDNNENAISLLKKIIIPQLNNTAVTSKLDELVTLGINKSIKKSNYKHLVGYAAFKPHLAKPYRQKIVAIIIDTLNNLWIKDQFNDMGDLSVFLKDSMGIDFTLNTILMKKFKEFVEKEGVIKKISAETPDLLLKKQKEVRIDLGPKYEFMKNFFKETPEVLDGQLKAMVLNAKGAYGTPVAFYRLYDLFADPKFTMKDKNEFLVGAIKDSLEKNKTITAPELVTVGYKLVQNHPDIPLIFIVSETLNRIKSLEESRLVWKAANKEFKERLKNVKPQFTTLMEAINLFDSGDMKKSFELFSVLSDETYLKTAEDYLTKFRKIVGDHKGIFIPDNDVNEKMHAIVISIEPLSSTKDVTTLLDVKVKIINALGSVMIKSDEKLTEDYGRTFSYASKGQINPDLQILPITEEQRAGAVLPQSFERTFGEIIGIKFDYNKDGEAIIMAITTDGTTYPFHRITSDTKTPLYPQGRFGITTQVSGKNKNTDHVMPVGSILTIKTDEKRPIQPVHEGKKLSIVYPFTGELLHPSSPIPRPFTGFYGADTHTINFEYDYPLSKGSQGTLKAISRCQVLDRNILCASHNKHWSRLKFSHIVKGFKAEEDKSKKDEFEMTPEGDDILKPPAELK